MLKDRGVYLLTGRVQDELGYLSLEVDDIERCPMIADPRYADSGLGNPVVQIPKRRAANPTSKRI